MVQLYRIWIIFRGSKQSMWLVMTLPSLLYAGAWGEYSGPERHGPRLMSNSHGSTASHSAVAVFALGICLVNQLDHPVLLDVSRL